MKMDTPTKPVESGGVKSAGEFRIKNSAKAFSILSSGLYSNKYQAVLRELGCNAYDSHVEAGKADVPFKVHLPTKMNPTFFVRDYGIGLDHDGVVNIYTTYFESTKQDSNDYVGCMGLGSKSPFSYTDNFSITAIKDGTRRLYTAYINEEGIPSIALLHEEETVDDNGVEVSFAVTERHDMYRFREEAARVYKWFEVKPEITGEDVTIPEIDYAERNIIPGVHVRDVSNSYRGDRAVAIMGNVAYPIKLDEAADDDDEDNKRRNDIRQMFESGGLVIEFDIGELDIAASREELSYIPHTIASIYKKGDEIIEHLGTYIEKELTGAKTKWDRMEVLTRLHKSNRDLFAPAISVYIDKNPRKFFKYTRFDLYGCKTYFALEDFHRISDDLQISYYQIEKRYADNAMIAHRIKADNISKNRINDDSKRISVYQLTDNDVTIVLQDDKGGTLPRIKEGVADGKISTRRVLSFRVTNKDADKDAIYKKVRRILGNPKIVLTSTLPKTNTTHMKSKKLSVYKFHEVYGGYNADKYKMKLEGDVSKLSPAIPTGKKHVYIPLQHKSVNFGSYTLSPNEFMRWVKDNSIDKFMRIDAMKVYGINKTTRKLIEGDKKWVNFFDLFEKEFKKIDWQKAKDEARRKYIRRIVNNGDYSFNYCPDKVLKELQTPDTPFGKLVDFYVTNKNVKKASDIEYDRLILGMKKIMLDKGAKSAKKMDKLLKTLEVEEMDKEVDKVFKDVKTIYPMLRHLNLDSQWQSNTNWKDASEYIKLVDSTL